MDRRTAVRLPQSELGLHRQGPPGSRGRHLPPRRPHGARGEGDALTDAALLALEDGTVFRGRAFGSRGEAFGEAVFNTAMSGYQEVLTDPSYSRQIVTMTSPQQGNYGTNAADAESTAVRVAGFVVREVARRPSSWRNERPLPEVLEAAGVPGIEGIDTRALTLRLRDVGAMRAGLSTVDLDPVSLVERVRASEGMEGADLARLVSCDSPWAAGELIGPPASEGGPILRVAAYDFGMKTDILRRLAAAGCDTTVLPAATPADEVLSGGYDGVFLSNGPGDPAVTRYGIEATRALLGRVPVFGICLGHQLLGLALGGRTRKMKFGHRGANQPVLDRDTGRVEITSHNHGFEVDPASFAGWEDGTDPREPVIVDSPIGRVGLTHWNLNDGTLEGLRCRDVPAFSVQYHPEASPGPHDASHLFAAFRRLMEG